MLNKIKNSKRALVFIGLSLVFGAALYGRLPETMATHWDSLGEANGFMSKNYGVFFPVAIMIFAYLLIIVLTSIDPKSENIEKFSKSLGRFLSALFAFLFFVNVVSLLKNIYNFDMVVPVILGLAALMYSIGSLLRDAEPNWTIGIRTPWTLSSENVWRKTHNLGGKLFKISAAVIFLSIFVRRYAFAVTIISIVAVALASAASSYFFFKKEKKNLNA